MSTAFDDVGQGELADLAGKYEALAALRRARDRGEPAPPKTELQALAARFPGALFELDTLPLDVIDERAAALREASGSAGIAPTPPWMGWMARYHALVRAELDARRSAPSERPRARATSTAIAAIAREASTTPQAVEAALFARRRRGVSR